MDFKNLATLWDYFKDEQTCIEYYEQYRWKSGKSECPHCGYTEKIYRTTRGYRCANKECGKKFSIKTGTIFECSNVKLRVWFAAIYLCSNHKKGISSHQLARDLGITQKSAWFVLHRVREMLKAEAPTTITNVFEADETFIGGKNKNRHWDKKVPESQGRSIKDKTPVAGMLERNGHVTLKVLSNTKAASLKPFIFDSVRKGAIVVTDEWLGYKGISHRYHHVVIKHKDGEYVRGAFHTNNIEGFWSLLKRSIYGIYHQVSPQHLHRYCNESSYRYNTREVTDVERFEDVLSHTQGRLDFNTLTNKNN